MRTLPLGLACRVHELARNDAGDDDRRVLREWGTYYVLPSACPAGVIELTCAWPSAAVGAAMADTADLIARTLTIRPLPD